MRGGLLRGGFWGGRSVADVLCSGKIGLFESRGVQLGNTGCPWLSCLLFYEALQFCDDLGTIFTSGCVPLEFGNPFSHRPDTCFYNCAFGTRVRRRLFANITLCGLCCCLVFGPFRLRVFFFFSNMNWFSNRRTGIFRRTRRLFRSSGDWRGRGRDLRGRF